MSEQEREDEGPLLPDLFTKKIDLGDGAHVDATDEEGEGEDDEE